MRSTETSETDETQRKRDHPDRAHLTDVDDGCGCTEIWEHLSENRED